MRDNAPRRPYIDYIYISYLMYTHTHTHTHTHTAVYVFLLKSSEYLSDDDHSVTTGSAFVKCTPWSRCDHHQIDNRSPPCEIDTEQSIERNRHGEQSIEQTQLNTLFSMQQTQMVPLIAGGQTLRQRVSHHMMRAQWNQCNYIAPAQLAKVVFPNIDVMRILATHRVDRHSNARKIVLVHQSRLRL